MLHEFLTERRDEIIARCEGRYRQRHPSWSREDLLSTIPRFIDEIIKAERREAGIPEQTKLPGDTDEARVQGEQRFRKGLKIREVADDYGTISQVIGEIAMEHGVELDARSYKLLNQCLDSGVAQAISIYFDLSMQRGNFETAESLGHIAHELRNALSSAVLSYNFIRTGQVGFDSKTARVLERSFNQLEALVAQMLAAVQLKSGVAPARERIAVRELIEEIDAGVLHERGISVTLHVNEQLTLIGDPRLVASAIANLLQNALKFTRSGGEIQLRAVEADGEITIEVEDECGGLSVPPEALFLPFVQGDHKTRGIGLGLAIARKAIEAHGGTLSARDLAGKGCVFTIVLPAGATESRAATTENAK